MKIWQWLVLIICIVLGLAMCSGAYAAQRHHPRVHHAHLIKNKKTIDVHVAVPPRLLAPKPPANHKGRAKKRR
jgi:hypothetical protein